jgi:hypothetical protein
MVSPPFARLLGATVAGALAATFLVAAQPGSATGSVERRRDTNPTGTRAGSLPNGVGNLKVSLVATADGRIRVSWKRPGRAKNFKKFVVKVGPSRPLDARTRSYKVSPKRKSIVVDRAADTYTTSGNYTFVRVQAYRKKGGGVGGSPGKWIQAPITVGCTAAPQDRLTIGDYNLRTWTADKGNDVANWSVRGPNAVSEILRSGARAFAIQEASGSPKPAYGNRSQDQWMLDELNQADPDPSSQWVDALTPEDYRPPKGRTPGLVGTRVFYDASKYEKLNSGLKRLIAPGWNKDSLIPWARLRSLSGDQAPFVLMSNHLRVGPGKSEYNTRVQQTAQMLDLIKELRAQFGDTVIVAGDMNSTANQLPLNYVQRELLKLGLYDSYATDNVHGAEYPSTNASVYPVVKTPLRRDYIMTYGPVQGSCSYTNQVYQQRSQEASDHFLQVATVPLPPVA